VVTASNPVSLLTATTVVTVEEAVAGLSAANDSPTALGSPTALTATVTAGSNVLYTWAFGDGSSGSGANASHIYPAAGVYTALVTASNQVGWLTATTVVTVEEAVAGLMVVNDSPTALGQPTALTATVTSGDPVAFTWAFGDGSSGSGANANHTYAAAGVYTAVVTASNCVSSATATTTVIITPREYRIYLPLVCKH
jgi:PKD repeat protein